MNKIFTSILALACLGVADASALTLTYNGQPVKDGDVINEGYVMDNILATWETGFDVESDHATEIQVIGTSDNLQYKEFFQNCTVSGGIGSCVPAPFDNTYSLEANTPLHLAIHRQSLPLTVVTTQGDITGILTVVDANNETDKVTVTVNYLVKPADEVGALDNVAANGEYVRLDSGNTLSYNLDGNTHIEVYSILGTRMIDRHVSGHGSLSLSGLGRGVYIYRAGKLSGKVVVK